MYSVLWKHFSDFQLGIMRQELIVHEAFMALYCFFKIAITATI